MKRNFVDSSAFLAAGYDESTQTLEVEFHDGDIYHYYEVPPVVYRDLLKASSSGQYFAYFIKPTYSCHKVAGKI
jgi:KTSC domain